MEARLQRRIQRYGWDRAAEAYEAGWKDSLAAAQAELLARAEARRGERVVDLACGTGLVTFPLAEAVGPAGRVIATDLSDRMVAALRAEAAARHAPTRQKPQGNHADSYLGIDHSGSHPHRICEPIFRRNPTSFTCA